MQRTSLSFSTIGGSSVVENNLFENYAAHKMGKKGGEKNSMFFKKKMYNVIGTLDVWIQKKICMT